MALPKGPEVPYWAPWTNLVWGTFIALLLCRGASWFLLETRAHAPEPVAAPEPQVL